MEIKNIEIQDSDGNVFYPHTNASVVKATDTSGLDGIAGKSSDTQTLLDKLADRVANKLIEKGMIANNLVTDNENMVLAAPMGKKLQEQISDVNKNIDFVINAEGSPNSLGDAIKSVWGKLPRNKYFSGNLWYRGFYTINGFVYPNADYGAVTAFSFAHPLLTIQCLNNNFYIQKYVTNSDFKRTIEIRLPYIAFGGKLYASYAFPVRLDSIPKVTLDDYYIDGIGHVDSFRNYLVNQEEVVFEFTKSDMNFELGKCYIGRTRFTIS